MITPLFSKPNHVSARVTKASPWETLPAHPMPEDHARWAISPQTQWHFLSAFEGRDPHLRVEHNNPAAYLHGVIADYDFKKGKAVDAERVRAACQGAPHLPALFHLTKSGGARIIWTFERPVGLWPELVKPLLKVVSERLRLGDLLPHWDKGAFEQPSTYYEWRSEGCETVTGQALPDHLVQAWVMEAAEQGQRAPQGPLLPLPEIARKIQELVTAGRWSHPHAPPARIEKGVRCRRFWDPDATDDTAAVIMDWGVHHFSDGGGGMTWAQLLGRDAVDRAGDELLGQAVENAWYENARKLYWIKEPDDTGNRQWREYHADVFRRYLRVSRGLSDEIRKGDTCSDVDRALNHIEQHRTIAGTMVEVFSNRETVVDGGRRWLNISGRAVMAPDSRTREEIEQDALFKEMMLRLHSLLPQEEVREHFLAWLRRFYTGAYEKNLGFGQAVYLIGPAGTGKSLIVEVIGRMVGGKSRGAQVLTGQTIFNAHLFKAGLVVVDDEVEANAENRMVMVQNLKALVANTDQSSHGKNATPFEVRWRGRVMVTANDDAVSAQLIPDLRASVRDKINLYRTEGEPCGGWTDEEMNRLAPMLGRWLLETKDHGSVVRDKRFGIRSYADERLASRSQEESPEEQLLQMIDVCGLREGETEMVGTSLEILGRVVANEDSTLRYAIQKEWTSKKVGKVLANLAEKHPERVSKGTKLHGTSRWVIKRGQA